MTLITPGWRNVRSLRAAFFAKGNRALFALMSKVKRQQGELSSWEATPSQQRRAEAGEDGSIPF